MWDSCRKSEFLKMFAQIMQEWLTFIFGPCKYDSQPFCLTYERLEELEPEQWAVSGCLFLFRCINTAYVPVNGVVFP